MSKFTRVVCILAATLGGVPAPSAVGPGSIAAGPPTTSLFAVDSAARAGALNGIAVISRADVWAVGSLRRGAAQHWDGSDWEVARTPGMGAGDELLAVSALGPDEVWAVGYDIEGDGAATLVEHWDGAAWRRMPSPNPSSFNTLYGVAALSPADVWAVGTQLDEAGYSKTLIQHWNGARWRTVPSPDPAETNNSLFAVAAVSATDVWAVGNYTPDPPAVQMPLVVHWDGTSWEVVAAPPVGAVSNTLRGVTVLAADDVWAVGHFSDGGPESKPLVQHWDGLTWSPVPAPTAEVASQLRAVAGESTGDALWAVGFSWDVAGTRHALAERWDGRAWRIVPAEQIGSGDNFLVGVDVLDGFPWAAGFVQAPTSQLRSLVERCCAR